MIYDQSLLLSTIILNDTVAMYYIMIIEMATKYLYTYEAVIFIQDETVFDMQFCIVS